MTPWYDQMSASLPANKHPHSKDWKQLKALNAMEALNNEVLIQGETVT